MRTTNATKSAFGAGKHVLARMQSEGWSVGPGGQLIKDTKVKKNTANSEKAALVAQKVAAQVIKAPPVVKKPVEGEPPKKSPKLELKARSEVVKPKSTTASPPPPPEPEIEESEVEFKLETTDSEYNPVENFSIANEMKRIAKEKEKKEKEKKKSNAPIYESDCAELPEHLNHNVSVFDRMRDRVAAEKAENRKINPFASATETEQESEIEFKGEETETDFEAELAHLKPQSVKPQQIKPQAVKPQPVKPKKPEVAKQKRETSHVSSDMLSDMSDLSDMPTLSDLTESEIGKSSSNGFNVHLKLLWC